MISFTVHIKPKAWQRVARGNGFSFVPKETRAFKSAFAIAALPHKPLKPLDGPLEVSIGFQMESPKKPSNPYPRGDAENYSKSVCDSLNGIIWADDSQIIKLVVTKQYGPKNLINITIKEVPIGSY